MLDEPTRGLTEMGIGKRTARLLASLLRNEVARAMCGGLPDLEYSAAPGVLIGARPGLSYFLPKAAQVVLDLGTGSVDPRSPSRRSTRSVTRTPRRKPTAPTPASAPPASARTPSLKTWNILRKARCCPTAIGRPAKAIHVLQLQDSLTCRMKKAH